MTPEQKTAFIQSLAADPKFTSAPLAEQQAPLQTFGISNQDIASALNIPLSTVQSYFAPPAAGTTPAAGAAPAAGATPTATTAPTTVTPTAPKTTAPLTPAPLQTTTPITTTPAPTTTPATSPGGSFTQGAALPNITTSQTQATAAPTWYTDYLSNLAKSSEAAAQGAQYVGAQPLQEEAFRRTSQAAGQFAPALQQAMGLTTTAAGRDSMAAAQPYMTAAGRSAYENIGQYMSPYTRDVVGQIGALGQRAIEQNLAPGVASGLVGAGQFGSRRGAQVLGQAIRDAQQNILAQQTQALQSGYGQALQAAQADLARQAGLAGTAGTLAGGDISRQLAAGQQLGSLAQAGQGMNIADINALATLGAQQQAIKQNEQLFRLQQLANQAGIVRGYSIPTSVSSTYTGPIPGAYAASPLQQISGIAALLGGLSQTKFGNATGNLVTKALEKILGSGGGSSDLSDVARGVNVAGSGVTNPFDADWWGGFAEGGEVKGYANGGDVRGYATAGSVTLPSAPMGLGFNDRAREEYFNEISNLVKAIEERADSPMNYFELAGQLLDPGRTGSAGEAFGRASTVLGQRMSKQKEMEIPLAQLKLQVAGQKYQTENEAKALEMVANAMGVTPGSASETITQGTVPTDMISRLTPGLFLTVGKLDPKLAGSLKDAFQMDVERRKLAQADVTAGMNYAEGIAKYGADFPKLLPPGIKVPGMPEAGQKTASPGPGAPAVTTSTAPAKTPPAEGTAADLEGMPLAARADVLRKRADALDEEFKTQRQDILQWTPQVVNRANDRLDELIEITRDPEGAKVFGLLQKQGILAAMAAAAKEAARVGQTTVEFPVQQFVEKLELSPTQQRILRRAQQLLTEEFFESAKATRSVLGPQMSNADTIIQQRPMATIEDAASTVDYWAKQRKLLNYQRAELYDGLNLYTKRYGPTRPLGEFFSSKEYKGIADKYDNLQRQFRQKYPGFGAQ